MANSISMKDIQRKTGILFRETLDAELAQHYSKTISQKLLQLSFYQEATTIFSYSPFGGEVDISYFNEQAYFDGKKVAFPICYSAGQMVAAIPDSPEQWETGKYGIRSPIERQSTVIDPNFFSLVIVPCTAFGGEKRMRVGMGAGYYDRYLPKCRNAKLVAVAYEVQKFDDICYDKWDVPLNAIVTEQRQY